MSQLKVPVSRNDHIAGPASAPVTLVEYGDYECPFCGLAHPTVKAVRDHYANDLRFVFRHFPLTQVHPLAEPAAETAEFAGDHSRFWEMHDALYEAQRWLSLPLLFNLASALGLSEIELRYALAQERYRPKVRNDFIGGVRSGVNGTPTFFVNAIRHNGPFDFENLAASIHAAFVRSKAPVPAGSQNRDSATPFTPLAVGAALPRLSPATTPP
jgi:protein-disulfide isomerase